ncbi:universal stress protein [Amorphoplanes digitatis]|uniref:Nucleotide-binding universal stress UspA family protein n=1 Tax=Actinoplanes digitatis TaxID=1868 RepID=A0A7W7MRR8_9ACTN|nr:universal stress protein [Actinoplanes digitatis]MBB4763880.1 nucleotide-binding universal stress UspA family protein [Actinoplanes digitatis]GID95639.1 universal stress protein [Actinoplanes digitatis]
MNARPHTVCAIVGYDGSPAASAVIDVGTALFPRARAWMTHMWSPPFASETLRRRLWAGTGHVDDFVDAIEREGEREAARIAGVGVTLAKAAGWDAEPLVRRIYGGEGLEFAQLAEKFDPDLVLLGSRGLGGTAAALGSVSDVAAHYTPRPVLVAPHPMLLAEQEALAAGPVLVGWDGSAGAEAAYETAVRLFPGREVLRVRVEQAGEHDDGAGVVTVRAAHRHGRSAHSVAEALAGAARARGAALLVVGSQGHSMVREMLLGSVTMGALHLAHRPVMVVPRRDRASA